MNLDDAIEAVRAESSERSAGSPATRARVLASLERSPSRRLHAVIAAVIASMFGASAFAWYAKPVSSQPPPPIASEQVAATTVERAAPAERRVARVELPVEAVEIDEPVEDATPMTVVEAAPTRRARGPAEPRPADVAAPARDAELALYATAHQLHFQARDMTAALDAWNRYLAAAPTGRLAPEARFNRIVALVRLERWDEAARALDALGDSKFRAAELARLRAIVAKHAK